MLLGLRVSVYGWSLDVMEVILFDPLRNDIMHGMVHSTSSPSDFGFWRVADFWAHSNGWELFRIGEYSPTLEPRRNHSHGWTTCVRPCSGVVPKIAGAQVESFPDIEASRCWRLRIPNPREGQNFTTLIMWLNIHAFIWLLTNLFNWCSVRCYIHWAYRRSFFYSLLSQDYLWLYLRRSMPQVSMSTMVG